MTTQVHPSHGVLFNEVLLPEVLFHPRPPHPGPGDGSSIDDNLGVCAPAPYMRLFWRTYYALGRVCNAVSGRVLDFLWRDLYDALFFRCFGHCHLSEMREGGILVEGVKLKLRI